MPDIREVLDHAAPVVREGDVTSIGRRARRRQLASRVAVATVLVVAVGSGALLFLNGDDTTHRIESGTTRTTSVATTTEATTTEATSVPATTVVQTTVPPGEDRLSTESRLGYAGLGPIKLGMSVDDAARVGHVEMVNDGCGHSVHAGADSGLTPVAGIEVSGASMIQSIDVSNPSISTISGVHVGSTRNDVLGAYPGAVEEASIIEITNGQGRVIDFALTGGTVVHMSLHEEGYAGVDPRC
jgi:hypothetical protein